MPVDIQNAPGVVLLSPVTIEITDFEIPFRIVDSTTQQTLIDKTGANAVRFSTMLNGIQSGDPIKTEELRALIAQWVLQKHIEGATS